MCNTLVTISCDESGKSLANELAKYLDTEIVSDEQLVQSEYLIQVKHGKLGLMAVSQSGLKPIELDFNKARINSGKDPLMRAIGPGSSSVVDAIAGWCNDALHRARQGLKVIAIEQNKVVAALVSNAMQQLSDFDVKSRITLLQGDSVALLGNLAQLPDVVYLDPMYPHKSKSAAVKKELVVLQKIVGQSGNNALLFDRAMEVVQKRVVVKRPHYADPVSPGKVGETRTKLVRFDIYKPTQC